MSEDYFLYFEELDLATRGRRQFRLGYCPEAIVLHHVGKSIGTRGKSGPSALSAYYMNASHIRYCMRHMRGALPWVFLDILCEIARSLRRRRWKTAGAIGCAFLRIGPSIPKLLRLI
jgi:GT2 family glycosyltransferase